MKLKLPAMTLRETIEGQSIVDRLAQQLKRFRRARHTNPEVLISTNILRASGHRCKTATAHHEGTTL